MMMEWVGMDTCTDHGPWLYTGVLWRFSVTLGDAYTWGVSWEEALSRHMDKWQLHLLDFSSGHRTFPVKSSNRSLYGPCFLGMMLHETFNLSRLSFCRHFQNVNSQGIGLFESNSPFPQGEASRHQESGKYCVTKNKLQRIRVITASFSPKGRMVRPLNKMVAHQRCTAGLSPRRANESTIFYGEPRVHEPSRSPCQP